MTTERIKEIQQTTGYPDSVSVQQALSQVWNEVEQESNRLEKPVMQKIADTVTISATLFATLIFSIEEYMLDVLLPK